MSNTANIITTQVVPEITKSAPYYDDFNEEKSFTRILYKAGVPVQSRDLTQMQTILQNQIERFGRHIFQEGSIVAGSGVSLTDVKTLNLQSTYANSSINTAAFINKTIRFSSANNTVIARVLQASPASDLDPPSLHVKYITGDEFGQSATIKVDNEELYANVVSTSNTTANGTLAFINDSVYFYKGFFLKVPTQALIIEKYLPQSNVSYRIGLELDEGVVTSSSDTSLLNPALEASAYQSASADRYRMNLVLAKRTLDSTDDTQFIETTRVKNGIIEKKIDIPIYSKIEEAWRRRHMDSEGNHVIRPFRLSVLDNDTTNLTARLSPGKAYIQGAEYETIADTNITVPKARTTQNVDNYDINCNYGNYCLVDDLQGTFDVDTCEILDIHNIDYANVDHSSLGNYNATKIGTCRVKDVNYNSGSIDPSGRNFELYIFDTQLSDARGFANAESFVKSATYTPGASFGANCNITTSNKVGGNVSGDAYLTETNLNWLVFRYPDAFIANNITNASYFYRRVFENIQFTNGVSSAMSASAGEDFEGASSSSNTAATVTNNFLVVCTNPQTSARASGEQIAVTTSISAGPPEQATLSTGNTSESFIATVYAKMEKTGTTQRTKTLVLANTTNFATESAANTFVNSTGSTTKVYLDTGQVTIQNPSKTASESLFISDVITVKKIWDLQGAALPSANGSLTGYRDVTNSYHFDNGQKDSFYDHASIRLKTGFAAPQGPLVVCTRYYKTTSDKGYFSVDSYPSLFSDITEENENIGTGYSLIPFHELNTGRILPLRDCIDFRPKRTNAANTPVNFALEGVEVPAVATDFQSDYSYYLGRIDLLVVTENRTIERVTGIPSRYPQRPTPPSRSMVIYELYIPPYTLNRDSLTAKLIENKTYTHKDIGLLDRRLQRVEYYTTLSLLEERAVNLQILDVDGLDRVKNGILVDSFFDHSLGASGEDDYLCNIDPRFSYLIPIMKENPVRFEANTSSGVHESANRITLSFTEEPFITQNTATKFTPVADYLFASFEGETVTVPDADIWRSNVIVSEVVTAYSNNITQIVKPSRVETTTSATDQDRGGGGMAGSTNDSQGNSVGTGVNGGYAADGTGNAGAGTGAGTKIICSAMNQAYGFGDFRNRIWLRYSRDHLTKEHEIGYHKIFLPLVNYAYYSEEKTWKTRVVKAILEELTVNRTIDIREEMRGGIHLKGRIYRKIFEPLCYLVGKYFNK